MLWKKSSSLVQGWGAVQINLGLYSPMDEIWGSGHLHCLRSILECRGPIGPLAPGQLGGCDGGSAGFPPIQTATREMMLGMGDFFLATLVAMGCESSHTRGRLGEEQIGKNNNPTVTPRTAIRNPIPVTRAARESELWFC
jgi:hypothetical protein